MTSKQVLRWLRLLDQRLGDLETAIQEAERLLQHERAEGLRIERETVAVLRTTFLQLLSSSTETD